MSQQVKNAHNLYIHAIQDGRVAEAQAQSVGDTYIQHSTGVPDGKEGFAAFFADFFERHPERQIKIVRTIEDGNLVFVHVHQYLNGGEAQWVTTDTFRADENGRIVEHWDVIDYYRTPENDQLDQIFGDFEIKDLDKKAENKKLVRRFLTEIFQNGELEQWSDYVADDLIQHNHEIGQGNYVVSYGQTQIDGVAYAKYDIFRLKNGKIVEHWDNKEVMPKVEDLTNRGKF
ncbi:ester cyclase [Streptococcus pneumoniae]|nr:ester cyclase [Streptococcus pneumoniae]